MFITNELNYEMSENDKEILKQIKIILVDLVGYKEDREIFYYLNYYFRNNFEELKDLIKNLSISFFIIVDNKKYDNGLINLSFVKKISKSTKEFSICKDKENKRYPYDKETLFSIEIPCITFYYENGPNDYLHFESFEQRDTFYSNFHKKALENTISFF